MQLAKGQVAVVTGAASGIGFALAEAFARQGLDIVLADVQEDALAAATARIADYGVGTLAVRTDVSKVESVQALADATMQRFGAVHLVCNNAGVGGAAVDAWTGPLAAWEWVFGVNFWGVVHGIRTFLPHLVMSGGGHIVNTASIAGCMTGFSPAYDATKHAVVAISDNLFTAMKDAGLPIGVSCLCPGWVRTGIIDSDRNWPSELGPRPVENAVTSLGRDYARRAVAESTTPAAVADDVVEAISENRFWIFPHQDFLDLAVARWERIAERLDPKPPAQVPGMPPRDRMIAELMAAFQKLHSPE
jgi:NAD(P)-dependent dehydrogenase (short-subunit alcohol dehydrogenase family)